MKFKNISYLCTRKHQEQSPLGGLANRAKACHGGQYDVEDNYSLQN